MQGQPITILLVEDDQAHAEIVKRNLQEMRVVNKIIHMEDGQEALDFLYRKEPYENKEEYPDPELILMDLRLPKVDGIEVIKIIKSDPELKGIPLVVLTTSESESDILGAYSNGAGSYLVKPFDFSKFSKLLETFGYYWLAWNRFPNNKKENIK